MALPVRYSFFFFLIWPCQVLVVACGIFSCSVHTLGCGMWNLASRPGIEPRPLHWQPPDHQESLHNPFDEAESSQCRAGIKSQPSGLLMAWFPPVCEKEGKSYLWPGAGETGWQTEAFI